MGACLARLCTEIGRHLHTEVDSSKASGAAGKSELVNLGDDEGNEEETLMKITIDGEMSAPTIQVSNENQTVLGHGLAVVDCAVNSSTQNDTSYWEWHIEESMNGSALEVEGGGDNDNCLMFGVSTKRNQNFYEILSNSAGSKTMMIMQCTKLMKKLPNISHEDIVGVAIDTKPNAGKPGNPTIQLYINGELNETFDLSRFRGDIYPAVWLPSSFAGGEKEVVVTFVHHERDFKQLSPHAKFQPLNARKTADIV
uniref:Uncharacterized protein n=1 Tax=Ditylum brightwellii TaxID=49249 RepID=A0A6U3RHZ8_9STRA|mmetsp:Transcript_24699/g.35913  ORF Transcript_24699/g.35913 Transcript_24699/m.35913 type:complete len:254 (+) Transcript_24699:194-955(+)